ncbi:ketosynthase chain-length factor [Pseudonocardia ailaonensis]|uniref:Ketosynthase chain-length factor n=1 Tax=Pseudonocardia ailaonensis TaxID=367279 RepID=A0ABN2N5J3_9PSEU
MTAAVVTGLGVVAPTGLGADRHWESTLAGRSGIGPVARFDASSYPARLAGEVHGFDAAEHVPSRLLPQTDHLTRMALAASDWAFADARISPERLGDFAAGVVTANSAGGFEFGQRELQKLWSLGSTHVSAYQSFAWFYAVNTGQISIRHGLRGPSGVLVTEQAGGLDSLAQARRLLRRGSELVVAGAVDAPVCPWGWTALLAGGRLSHRDDPALAFRPFDSDASGAVAGEGGALLVVERADTAAARGAPVYGTIAGTASTFDPRPGSGREPGLRRAVEMALTDAGIGPAEVDVVFADAAGVPEEDAAEAAALRAVFGPNGVPVTAPKTLTGRLASGGSALDAATALLALRNNVIPATTAVVDVPDEYGLDLVRDGPRQAELRTAVVLARGVRGFNAALVLTTEGERP